MLFSFSKSPPGNTLSVHEGSVYTRITDNESNYGFLLQVLNLYLVVN